MTYTVVIVISANLKIGISRHTSYGHWPQENTISVPQSVTEVADIFVP